MTTVPELENGYTRIANGIIEALAATKIPGSDMQVLMVVFRMSYGWHSVSAEIPLSAFVKMTGLRKQHVVRSIKNLRNKNILTVTKNGNKTHSTYRFNKRFTTWESDIVTKNGNETLEGAEITKDSAGSLPNLVTITKNGNENEISNCDDSGIKENNSHSSEKSSLPKMVTIGNPTFSIKDIKDYTNIYMSEKKSEAPKTQKKEKVFEEESFEFRLSNLLFKKILANNPGAKKPNLQSWCKPIDLLIRINKKDPQEIANMIAWCQNDTFWYKNILSTEKLRKHFDRMTLDKQDQKRGSKKLRNNVSVLESFLEDDNG